MQRLLGRVKSALSDPVRLLASMAAIRCVFFQLATHGVEIQLGKLAVGGVRQTKTKPDIPIQNMYCITGCNIVVFNLASFLNIYKNMLFLLFCIVKIG